MDFTTLAEISAYRKDRQKNALLRALVSAALALIAVTAFCLALAIR